MNALNKYRLEDGKDAYQVMQLLDDKLYEFNNKTIHRGDGSLFSRVVLSDNKDVIAGIAGWFWAGVGEITHLWVDGSVRNDGIGKMLLEAADEEAHSRGCHTIMVRSYSFQAPKFYEKHGYRVQHVLEGFPTGYSHYMLTKRILTALQ